MSVEKNIKLQEKRAIALALGQCRLAVSGVKLARDKGASDYQVLVGLIPLLKSIGSFGGTVEGMIETHDRASSLQKTLEIAPELRGPGRDKDV